MGAKLTARIPICCKGFPARWADKMINGFPLYFLWMGIPPSLTTCPVTELFSFGTRNMREWHAAIQAGIIVCNRLRCYLILGFYACQSMIPAESLYTIF
jgi:hypothetical protein